MRKPNIAILGATGVVGREITKIIDELKIDFNEIKFLSSAKSAGTKLEFQGKTYTVEEATPESLEEIKKVYDLVIEVGTYPVSSIKTAEAIKVVENSQRDINIAFMNELAMVFDRMGIDTNEVVDGK